MNFSHKTVLLFCFIACFAVVSDGVTFYSTNWLQTARSGDISEAGMSFNVWIPDTPDVELKGVLFWWHGSTYWPNDWDENPHPIVQRMRKTATALDFAIIHRKETSYPPVNCFPAETVNAFEKILQKAAEVSGHPELMAIPQMHTGFSGGGIQCHSYSHLISERVIAVTSIAGVESAYYSGSGCSVGQLTADALEKVPLMLLAGRSDVNVPPNRIENIFDEQRSFYFPAAFAAYPVNHGVYVPYQELGLYYMAETYRKRLELAGGYPEPTNGIVSLPELPLESGWLAQAEDFSSQNVSTNAYAFPEIAPYNAYTGEVANASWLPSEGAAIAYRAFAATDGVTNSWVNDGFRNGPLAITNLVAFTVCTNGQTISIGIDPRTFDDTRTIERMALYLDDAVVGTDTNAPWEFNVVLTNAWRGLHALTAVAEADDGEKSSCFRVIVINDAP